MNLGSDVKINMDEDKRNAQTFSSPKWNFYEIQTRCREVLQRIRGAKGLDIPDDNIRPFPLTQRPTESMEEETEATDHVPRWLCHGQVLVTESANTLRAQI